MDIHSIRQQLRVKSIYDIPLRATFYARVSSEKDEQLNSLDNQIAYYENLIRKNRAWKFVPGYIDEGISGISTTKREDFNRMIDDAENGKFDLIITKEISRFARNTLDSILFTRQLISAGVGVFFQNDNINTFDDDSELRLSIMSSIAQDELRKLSSRIKFGHQQAIKSNVVLGNSRIFGYKKDKKRLVIDEEQAAMVRELYELYATDEYSLKQIERIFWDKGYRNYNGNKIAHTTMSNIISNPKYKGYYVGNKVHIIDMFTKKQKFLPPEEWVMFKDESGAIVPAIVSEELWDKANAVLARRSNDVKGRQGICNHPNLLTGKLFCTCCNKPYYRKATRNREDADNSRWVCSGKINNGTASCNSFTVLEGDIKPILYDVLQDTKTSADFLIEEYAAMYKETLDENDLSDRIARAEQSIKLIKGKKSKLLEYNVQGKIDDSDFLAMTSSLNMELKEQESILAELIQQRDSSEEFASHIKSLRDVLIATENEIKDGVIDKTFINKYIDKIYVTPISETEMRLEIKIFTGETTEKYFSKLCSRTGHTSKKMIETAERNMK